MKLLMRVLEKIGWRLTQTGNHGKSMLITEYFLHNGCFCARKFLYANSRPSPSPRSVASENSAACDMRRHCMPSVHLWNARHKSVRLPSRNEPGHQKKSTEWNVCPAYSTRPAHDSQRIVSSRLGPLCITFVKNGLESVYGHALPATD